MPAHHNLEAYLHGYLEAAGLRGDPRGPLFRPTGGWSKEPTDRALMEADVWRMIRSRASEAGIETEVGCHTFRATGITEYLKNGGRLEVAQATANHESPRATRLYDRREDEVSLDEVERILVLRSLQSLILQTGRRYVRGCRTQLKQPPEIPGRFTQETSVYRRSSKALDFELDVDTVLTKTEGRRKSNILAGPGSSLRIGSTAVILPGSFQIGTVIGDDGGVGAAALSQYVRHERTRSRFAVSQSTVPPRAPTYLSAGRLPRPRLRTFPPRATRARSETPSCARSECGR